MVWLFAYVATLLAALAVTGAVVGVRTGRQRRRLVRRAKAAAAKAAQWRGLAADGAAVKVAQVFSRIGMSLVARDGPVMTFAWPTRPWLTGFLLVVTFPFGAVYFLAYRFAGGRPVPVIFDISKGHALSEPSKPSARRRAA